MGFAADSTKIALSICISTFNRAKFIGATLDSILNQSGNNCEVVVLDGASTDDTEQVLSEYTRRSDRVRYIRQDRNNGVDRDFDRVVLLARGEYCWLMSDDDTLKPGAVDAVLRVLRQDYSLVIVNAELKNLDMTQLLKRHWIDFESDRVYGPAELDRLFVEVGGILRYIGSIIIKRAIWLERQREPFYDSWFVHVGVIFQAHLPGEALVLTQPLISVRVGNAKTFSPRRFEIHYFKWPTLVWSLALSSSVKQASCDREPWRKLKTLLICRAQGWYALPEYRRLIRPHLRSPREALPFILIALLPGVLINALLVLYYSVSKRETHSVALQFLKESRFYLGNLRLPKRVPWRTVASTLRGAEGGR